MSAQASTSTAAAPVKKAFPILKKSTSKPATSAEPGVAFLPISRVHRIIKADKDVKICSKESIFLMSKATEFMIGKLTNAAYTTAKLQKRSKTVKYTDLSQVVNSTGQSDWFYLSDPIPAAMPLAAALAARQLVEDEEKAFLDPKNAVSNSGPLRHLNSTNVPYTTGSSGPGKRGRPKKNATKEKNREEEEEETDEDTADEYKAPAVTAGPRSTRKAATRGAAKATTGSGSETSSRVVNKKKNGDGEEEEEDDDDEDEDEEMYVDGDDE